MKKARQGITWALMGLFLGCFLGCCPSEALAADVQLSVTALNDIPSPVQIQVDGWDSSCTKVVDAVVMEWNGNDNTYSAETIDIDDTTAELRFTFINDSFTCCDYDTDRNAFIDSFQVGGGPVREAEDFDKPGDDGGTDPVFCGCGKPDPLYRPDVMGEFVADCGNQNDFVEYSVDTNAPQDCPPESECPKPPSCLDVKVKGTGKKVFGLLKAFAKNAQKPNDIKLSATIAKVQSKFTKAFDKGEDKGDCVTVGDHDPMEAKADAVVLDTFEELDVAQPAPKCLGRKSKAAGKKVYGLLKAFAKNVKSPNDPKLAAAVSKVQSKFTKAFTKAEMKGDCLTLDDADPIESKLDAAVLDIFTELTVVASPSGAFLEVTSGLVD
jgi:hypothetical protein